MNPLKLLEACEHCYSYPQIQAGPDGRDGATVQQIDGRTVLVFRGTICNGEAGFLDWLNDLRARLVSRADWPGRVHHGFAESFDDLRIPLERYAFSKGLVITGHSKGGALALLAGWHFRYLEPEIVTFAAPMVGDRSFLASYKLGATCYENPHDLVPRLPPVGYRAVGSLIGPGIDWDAPHGVAANHALETGYRPWIAQQLGLRS